MCSTKSERLLLCSGPFLTLEFITGIHWRQGETASNTSREISASACFVLHQQRWRNNQCCHHRRAANSGEVQQKGREQMKPESHSCLQFPSVTFMLCVCMWLFVCIHLCVCVCVSARSRASIWICKCLWREERGKMCCGFTDLWPRRPSDTITWFCIWGEASFSVFRNKNIKYSFRESKEEFGTDLCWGCVLQIHSLPHLWTLQTRVRCFSPVVSPGGKDIFHPYFYSDALSLRVCTFCHCMYGSIRASTV